MTERVPTIFDSIINEITKNFAEVAENIRTDYNGDREGFEDVPEDAPEPDESPEEGIDIDAEIVRLLQKAEKHADQGYGHLAHLDIVDRLMILRNEL